MTIQNLYKEYKRLEEITISYAEKETEEGIEEELWFEAYKNESKVFDELENEIVKAFNVKPSVARSMIYSDEFESLMALNIA